MVHRNVHKIYTIYQEKERPALWGPQKTKLPEVIAFAVWSGVEGEEWGRRGGDGREGG